MTMTMTTRTDPFDINPFEVTVRELDEAVELLCEHPDVPSAVHSALRARNRMHARQAYYNYLRTRGLITKLLELKSQASPDRQGLIDALLAQLGEFTFVECFRLLSKHINRITERPYTAPEAVLPWWEALAERDKRLDEKAKADALQAKEDNSKKGKKSGKK